MLLNVQLLVEEEKSWPIIFDLSPGVSQPITPHPVRKIKQSKTNKMRNEPVKVGKDEEKLFFISTFNLFLDIDPLGRPTVTAGSDHCFYTCRPFVRTSPLFKIKRISSENNVPYWQDCVWVWPSGSLMTPVLYFVFFFTMMPPKTQTKNYLATESSKKKRIFSW